MSVRPPWSADPLTRAVLRLADGDRSAFDEVFALVRGPVEATCRRVLGDGPDAEDAAQTALWAVFRDVSDYDPARAPALAWILTRTLWEARTLRRKQQRAHAREAPPEAADHASDQATDPLTADDDHVAVRRLLDMLGALPPSDREALEAWVELGPRPDLEPATFRKRVQRALSRLRDAWGTVT